jgi:hypothetical protein
MQGFKVLSGDVDYLSYGGKWYRVVPGTNELRYHIIELINWEDAVGSDADGGPTYNVDLSEVDLGALSAESMRSAMECCGVDRDYLEDLDPGQAELMIAECCHSYGCKAPLWSADGNDARKLLAEAKQESRALDDPDAHDRAMNRTVNAIGSTAAEYMTGDIWSALRRAKEDPTPSQAIILKMYGACDRTLGGEPIPEDLRNDS